MRDETVGSKQKMLRVTQCIDLKACMPRVAQGLRVTRALGFLGSTVIRRTPLPHPACLGVRVSKEHEAKKIATVNL